jgi:hypothetical protein
LAADGNEDTLKERSKTKLQGQSQDADCCVINTEFERHVLLVRAKLRQATRFSFSKLIFADCLNPKGP